MRDKDKLLFRIEAAMSTPTSYHLPWDEFRRQGHALINWIADYHEHVEQYPVLSQVAPGDIRAHAAAAPAQQGEPFAAVLADVDRVIMPGITHWQSPNFFAFFPSNTSGPAILGDLLSSGLGVQGMLWLTSPACTELETHVMDWLVEMLGLPEQFKSTATGGGVIQDSASSATLTALLAARERATGWAINRPAARGNSSPTPLASALLHREGDDGRRPGAREPAHHRRG
jgi:aromatic-L-amino-acid decarboxylase